MEEKSFKMKTEYCHILSEKIVLSSDGIVGNVAKVTIAALVRVPTYQKKCSDT